jgi:ATP-dependent 26S proteasome regulatory subunit
MRGNPCFPSAADEVGGLEKEKRLIRERILLPILQPEFFWPTDTPAEGDPFYRASGMRQDDDRKSAQRRNKGKFCRIERSEVFQSLYEKAKR